MFEAIFGDFYVFWDFDTPLPPTWNWSLSKKMSEKCQTKISWKYAKYAKKSKNPDFSRSFWSINFLFAVLDRYKLYLSKATNRKLFEQKLREKSAIFDFFRYFHDISMFDNFLLFFLERIHFQGGGRGVLKSWKNSKSPKMSSNITKLTY